MSFGFFSSFSCFDNMSRTSENRRYHFSDEKRIFIKSQLLQGIKPKDVLKNWPFKRRKPALSNIYYFRRKLTATGSIKNRIGQGRPVSVSTPELDKKVLKFFSQHKKLCARNVGNELKTSDRTVRRILKKNEFKPYKLRIALDLVSRNHAQRLKFVQWFLDLSDKGKNLI